MIPSLRRQRVANHKSTTAGSLSNLLSLCLCNLLLVSVWNELKLNGPYQKSRIIIIIIIIIRRRNLTKTTSQLLSITCYSIYSKGEWWLLPTVQVHMTDCRKLGAGTVLLREMRRTLFILSGGLSPALSSEVFLPLVRTSWQMKRKKFCLKFAKIQSISFLDVLKKDSW